MWDVVISIDGKLYYVTGEVAIALTDWMKESGLTLSGNPSKRDIQKVESKLEELMSVYNVKKIPGKMMTYEPTEKWYTHILNKRGVEHLQNLLKGFEVEENYEECILIRNVINEYMLNGNVTLK